MVFEEFCRLGEALERMKKQLEGLMLEDDHREYGTYIESLHKEVELTFQAKLENAKARMNWNNGFGYGLPSKPQG
ncbi:hypothetical protein V6N12_059207 [Hibiscus sabdariffa]|uniref:Uncharacterized protein n=1 Tax=Hibiscus sabdariffa TaxID=183260 RepID=A0ABR2EX93_9ROSI